MPEKELPQIPVEMPKAVNMPEIYPVDVPKSSEMLEQQPDIIPDEDPFETTT